MERARRGSVKIGCQDHLPFRERSLYCRRRYKVTAQQRYLARHGVETEWVKRRDRKYGLAPGQFDAMLAEQEHKCAICRRPESSTNKGVLSVDHDHESGLVRGLLCDRCNRGIGLLQDNPETLEVAARYLRERTP